MGMTTPPVPKYRKKLRDSSAFRDLIDWRIPIPLGTYR